MNFFRLYLLPGFVFQSVVIGGGYATGRELVAFFFEVGPIGGMLGLLVSGLVFGAVLAVGFELARMTGAYDYRQFMKVLLGRFWVAFEITFLCMLLLVLSVVGSASGELFASVFGLPALSGTLVLMALIALLTFYGSDVIKRVFSAWSILLYAVYIALFVMAFLNYGPAIGETFQNAELTSGWISSGILYSGYNVAVLPLVLFAITGHQTRKQTMGAGFMAGAIAIIPALIFYTAMMAKYPEIGDEAVPATFLMAAMNAPVLELIFQIVIFGTFIETGAALLHGVNERLDKTIEERGSTLPQWVRPVVAIGCLLVAIFGAAQVGIVDLIAQGYATLTLAFIVVLIVPMLTIGVKKLWDGERTV